MVSILPLSISQAEVRRSGQKLIGPIDAQIESGGPTVFLGPNGAGKTTFLKACHGITRLSHGHIAWNVERSAADLKQAYVFQTPVLLRRSVIENVIYPLRIGRVPRSEATERADQALKKVGLEGKTKQRASDLSGGEKQKLALARALVVEPEVLFLDEPTASQDGRAKREIEDILNATSDAGTKLILATHDLGQARRLASEVFFLLNGQLHEVAPAADFFERPSSSEARAFLRGDIVE